MTTKTQNGLNSHLKQKGQDPVDAVWGTMLDVIYLMPTFIEKGGIYAKDIEEAWPYPSPSMKVSHGDKWLLLRREIREGYPVIRLTGPDDVTDTNSPWGIFYVHPDHLDTALCYLLEITDCAA